MDKISLPWRTGLLAAGWCCATAFAEDPGAADHWQRNALFDPSPNQLARERAGAVMIYDGLTDRQVERALNTQFDRLDSMMFVNVIVTDNRGSPVRDPQTGAYVHDADDGCE